MDFKRITVVGNGNIDVGNKTATRDGSAEPRLAKRDLPKTERPRTCRAMQQQCGDIGRGNHSSPQKFVQLVGYRDPNARPEPWIRPQDPVKR
jgi:hypothetical protein